jgi:hypothetical protein
MHAHAPEVAPALSKRPLSGGGGGGGGGGVLGRCLVRFPRPWCPGVVP